MTKKEKILIALFKELKSFEHHDLKYLLKFIHTASFSYENMSPFSWSEHYGEKRTKIKLKNLYK
jgi:hypothetical protein